MTDTSEDYRDLGRRLLELLDGARKALTFYPPDHPLVVEGFKHLEFLLSDKGQTIWANAYLRPVRDVLPKDAVAKLFPPAEYARVKAVDFKKVAAAQKAFADRYLADVR